MNILKLVLEWLIPSTCMLCKVALNQRALEHSSYNRSTKHSPDHSSSYFSRHSTHIYCCNDCYQDLPFQSNCCQQCGQLYTADADHCGRCIVKPPVYDACFCPFRYEPPINQQIQNFKYREQPELAKRLAALLHNELISNHIAIPDILISVPMHTSKLRERGYNQSLLIAKELAILLDIPHSYKLIEKHRSTASQTNLSLKQRQSNVRGSFRIKHKNITFKHIAIVDDVFTTGSTASEIAKILKRNGVDYIQIWGIAHTI